MITLSKIAALAHVSVSTASKAFSGSKEVNEETRELIFNIAKQYDCFKKYYNIKYPKYVIAVICPEFKSSLYSSYLNIIQDELSKNNCEICVAATEFSAEAEKNLLEYYTMHSTVDGIIVINPKTNLKPEIQIPLASVGKYIDNGNIISTTDNFDEIICEAIKYFKEKNVKDIGFIGETLTTHKNKTFLEAMEKNSLSVNKDFIFITKKRFEEGGYYAMEKLFEKNKLPRAIICAYDNMAIGAMRCIFDKGLKIPADIAVLGMDNNVEAKYINPQLSSIDYGVELACRTATKELMNKITDKPVKYKIFIPCELNLKESTNI